MQLDVCFNSPLDWEKSTIEKVCQKITSGGTPSRKHPDYYVGGAINWVKTKELNDEFIEKTEESITNEALKNSSAKLLPAGTILLAMYGATVGMLGILSKEMACNQACCALITNKEFDRDFLFYQLLFHRNQLKGLATGAAQQNLSGQQIKTLILPFPKLKEQKLISCFFRSIDDRITLLRETNATLESIAQTLFKSWFVNFDPVHAKQQGRLPDGMDAETASLFPDSFETSELGEIPKGWNVRVFSETINIIGGGTPKTSIDKYWNGTIPWFSIVDVPSSSDIFVVDTKKHITDEGLKNSSTKMLKVGTTIISARGTVGSIALVGQTMAMNQSCYGLQGKADDIYFTYFSTYKLVEILKQKSHGSVFDTITQKTLDSVNIIYPTILIINAFENFLTPLMSRIKINLEQAQTLAKIRDTLLPRLISGQLRIKDEKEQPIMLQEAA